MGASGLQEIVTEVKDSLGYCLKAEQKQPYFRLLPRKICLHLRPRITLQTLHKSLTATSHTLHNNYTPPAPHTRDWHISGDVGRGSMADSVARIAETLR